MSKDHREEIPLMSDDELRDEAPLAPRATPLPDADRKRLEALLRELLRDNSLRELFSSQDA